MFCPFYLLNLSLFIKCSPLADIFESWCDVVLMIGFIYYKGIGSAEFQSFAEIVRNKLARKDRPKIPLHRNAHVNRQL